MNVQTQQKKGHAFRNYVCRFQHGEQTSCADSVIHHVSTTQPERRSLHQRLLRFSASSCYFILNHRNILTQFRGYYRRALFASSHEVECQRLFEPARAR
jgi:hypothetical protein